MPNEKHKLRSTIRLKALKRELVANGSSMRQKMLKVGYSEAYSRQPSKLMKTDAFRSEIAPVIDQMDDVRGISLEFMKKKAPEASYGELARGVDVTTKHIELLSGRATKREAGIVAHLSTQELLKMIEAPEKKSKDTFINKNARVPIDRPYTAL